MLCTFTVLRNSTSPKPNPVLAGQESDKVGWFSYMGNCITHWSVLTYANDWTEIHQLMSSAHHVIIDQRSSKGSSSRVGPIKQLRSVVLKTEDFWGLSAFGNRCLRNNVRVWLDNFINNAKVRCVVLTSTTQSSGIALKVIGVCCTLLQIRFLHWRFSLGLIMFWGFVSVGNQGRGRKVWKL